MTVFLGKSSHSESNGPPFEKWKILNISHHPKFFSSLKKNVFLMTVFLGKSSHSDSNGPPFKSEKFWTQNFFQVLFWDDWIPYDPPFPYS